MLLKISKNISKKHREIFYMTKSKFCRRIWYDIHKFSQPKDHSGVNKKISSQILLNMIGNRSAQKRRKS